MTSTSTKSSSDPRRNQSDKTRQVSFIQPETGFGCRARGCGQAIEAAHELKRAAFFTSSGKFVIVRLKVERFARPASISSPAQIVNWSTIYLSSAAPFKSFVDGAGPLAIEFASRITSNELLNDIHSVIRGRDLGDYAARLAGAVAPFGRAQRHRRTRPADISGRAMTSSIGAEKSKVCAARPDLLQDVPLADGSCSLLNFGGVDKSRGPTTTASAWLKPSTCRRWTRAEWSYAMATRPHPIKRPEWVRPTW